VLGAALRVALMSPGKVYRQLFSRRRQQELCHYLLFRGAKVSDRTG